MGGRQIRPAGVYNATALQLQNAFLPGHRAVEPPWFRVMNSIPPAEPLVRTVTPRHRAPDRRATKPRNLYRPQNLSYLEDALRATFFKDHPWELARPRVILELDGKDYRHCDWSKGLRQPGMPLSGECVVQRQLWLMQNEKLSKRKAYDLVRWDFYRLRQAEEIESRIALEEARYVGAYFGKTKLEVGMMLEDKEYENWKIWAGKQTEKLEARANADIETFEVEDIEDEFEEADRGPAPSEAELQQPGVSGPDLR
ncbi:mitochondrial ribosomal protein [Hirsutella rhossiliensis]|uniref:Small ribosomal subunit protein mS23 n=1 Tax=Hirsutella rhossiliensis TaxID=111463 RepID=A0A9P8SMN1_9HYPO|nr:mitochondrial ribosomal protein [Hirsutella rhossiliensis]KAH0966306.1 mitochondrial ribosomal protein [Hirsutella rhossiliensis]